MTPHSLLHERHRKLGGQFAPFAGRDLPARYGDPNAEAATVRDGAALFDLSFRGSFAVAGADRVRFLQGMVTNDVAALAPGAGCHAAALTPKGRVRTDLWVYAEPDRLRIEVDDEHRTLLWETLEKHIIAEDVRLEAEHPSTGLLSLQGPAAPEWMATLLDGPLPDREFARVVAPAPGGDALLTRRTDYTGSPGFEIRAPAEVLVSIWDRLVGLGARPAGTDAFDIVRIEAGIPITGRDMDESTLFPELGLDGAVSQTKGCYLGQEVVARVRDRGHVNRQFVGFRLLGDRPAPPGSTVTADGQATGVLTSTALSVHCGGPIALGFVRSAAATPDTPVSIEAGGTPIAATVSALPFPGPGGAHR